MEANTQDTIVARTQGCVFFVNFVVCWVVKS